MRAAASLLAAALALALATAAPAQQSTTLRGLETENEARAFAAVGRLDGPTGYCTATLVAPDLVLTAAHCLFDRAGRPLLPDSLNFNAGLTAGAASARRGISQIELDASFDPRAPMTAANVRHDLALLRLAEPIPTSVLDPFVLHQGALPAGPVSIVSYGRGRSDHLSRQKVCRLLGQQAAILTFDCDVTFGSSGAPVFTHLNGRGRILSVISGMGTQGGKTYAYGMELPHRVALLKRQMRANRKAPAARIKRLQEGSGRRETGAKFVPARGS
jgi:protease YdgD